MTIYRQAPTKIQKKLSKSKEDISTACC